MTSGSETTILEFARAASIAGWWWWALLILSLGLVIYGCIRFYRRDTEELAAPARYTLIGLRLMTLLALVFFFFRLSTSNTTRDHATE